MEQLCRKDFLFGRSNMAITIFVPYDCTNTCKFCTSKSSYCKYKSNLDSVLDSIERINNLAVEEIVITGGEPLLDLNKLDSIINAISSRHKIFINTTFCGDTNEIIEYINNNNRINAVNISRHFETFEQDCKLFNNIIEDKYIDMINKPVKINCIISENSNIQKIIERWENHNVRLSFRADYRYINQSNLKTLTDDITVKLATMDNMEYINHGGCDVCFDVSFKFKDKLSLNYHRGLEKSSIQFGNNVIVNDIIIRQDGLIMYDWGLESNDIDEMLLQFDKMLYN